MNKVIAFDLSSGDKGSAEAIKAAVDFCILNKDWKVVGFTVEDLDIKNKPTNLEIEKCTEVIEMTDGPLQVRRKKDSTLVRGIESVLEGRTSGLVSSAASGPLVTAGFLMLKPIEGTKPAFAPIFKNINGKQIIALDIGANIGADAHTLEQYAIMGSIYSKAMGFSENPIVKQLNIGEEDKKGTELQTEAFKLMSENSDINFAGNVEATELLIGDDFDVVVTEAYAGNVALKSVEGSLYAIKEILMTSINSRFLDKVGIGILAKNFKKNFKSFAKGLSGGACVIGLNELLIKSHGGSDANEFMNTLDTAKRLIENDLINKIKDAIDNNEESIKSQTIKTQEEANNEQS